MKSIIKVTLLAILFCNSFLGISLANEDIFPINSSIQIPFEAVLHLKEGEENRQDRKVSYLQIDLEKFGLFSTTHVIKIDDRAYFGLNGDLIYVQFPRKERIILDQVDIIPCAIEMFNCLDLFSKSLVKATLVKKKAHKVRNKRGVWIHFWAYLLGYSDDMVEFYNYPQPDRIEAMVELELTDGQKLCLLTKDMRNKGLHMRPGSCNP